MNKDDRIIFRWKKNYISPSRNINKLELIEKLGGDNCPSHLKEIIEDRKTYVVFIDEDFNNHHSCPEILFLGLQFHPEEGVYAYSLRDLQIYMRDEEPEIWKVFDSLMNWEKF